MPVFLGLDCGGSTTRALASEGGLKPVFRGSSGAGNLCSVPQARLLQNLRSACKGAPKPDFVCGCFAGLLAEKHKNLAIGLLTQLFPRAHVRAEPDYLAALRASPRGTDLCVIAGTGAIVCSMESGDVQRTGGRGYILGDHGSAFRCGRDALVAYLNHPQAVGQAMKDAIFEMFDSLEEPVIVESVYRSRSVPARLAKLSPVLQKEHDDGREYARAVVEFNMGELARVTAAHLDRFRPKAQSANVCLVGGVWHAGSMSESAYRKAVKALKPSVAFTFTPIAHPPVHGALQIALEMPNVH